MFDLSEVLDLCAKQSRAPASQPRKQHLKTSEIVLVSVVIPTLDRPQLLSRALTSVFNQTYRHLEVIVVVDRPDADTNAVLRTVDDPRLRVVVNPQPLNAQTARNLGIDHANGAWIAFLDDDDEWLPAKIEKQLALGSGRGDVLVSCLSRVVTPHSTQVQPRVVYNNSMPLDEYLFNRSSPSSGVGFIQTSSFMMPRSVLEKLRFAVDALHDDWDFILRLTGQFGIRIETVPEVLVVLYFDEPRPSFTARGKWRDSLAWIDRMRPMITPRSYGCFCLGTVASRAARERAYPAAGLLLWRAFRYGSPSLWSIGTFIGLWLLPRDAYRRLRDWSKRGTGGGDHANAT
jgi:glycosyltransferase involved in cell wall biosynthesis